MRSPVEWVGDQIAITYRHILIEDVQPTAREYACAAECAGDQGRFEALHGALLANPSQPRNGVWESRAVQAGIPDVAEFLSCLRDQRHDHRITRDREAGRQVGVSAVPTLVINGTVVTGAKPLPVLEGFVREAIRNAR